MDLYGPLMCVFTLVALLNVRMKLLGVPGVCLLAAVGPQRKYTRRLLQRGAFLFGESLALSVTYWLLFTLLMWGVTFACNTQLKFLQVASATVWLRTPPVRLIGGKNSGLCHVRLLLLRCSIYSDSTALDPVVDCPGHRFGGATGLQTSSLCQSEGACVRAERARPMRPRAAWLNTPAFWRGGWARRGQAITYFKKTPRVRDAAIPFFVALPVHLLYLLFLSFRTAP